MFGFSSHCRGKTGAVHAWPGLNGDGAFAECGNTMTVVEKLVNALDADTRSVSPAQFTERITSNCG